MSPLSDLSVCHTQLFICIERGQQTFSIGGQMYTVLLEKTTRAAVVVLEQPEIVYS